MTRRNLRKRLVILYAALGLINGCAHYRPPPNIEVCYKLGPNHGAICRYTVEGDDLEISEEEFQAFNHFYMKPRDWIKVKAYMLRGCPMDRCRDGWK